MDYILKYNADTYELIEITRRKDNYNIGFVKEENTVYIPCQNKEDALKTYKSILREQINYIKAKKRNLNLEKMQLEKRLLEVEANEKQRTNNK